MSEVPIVVGVGDFVNRSTAVADAREPLALILEAIEVALKDAGLPDDAGRRLKSSIDSIDVVRTWTWPYDDLPGDIARNLGVTPRHTFYSDHGGNKPAKLFDDAARRIAQGKTKVAVVTGGEALASCESPYLLEWNSKKSTSVFNHVVSICLRRRQTTPAPRMDKNHRRCRCRLFRHGEGSRRK
jgi:acetyl-CoA acetyltransferase